MKRQILKGGQRTLSGLNRFYSRLKNGATLRGLVDGLEDISRAENLLRSKREFWRSSRAVRQQKYNKIHQHKDNIWQKLGLSPARYSEIVPPAAPAKGFVSRTGDYKRLMRSGIGKVEKGVADAATVYGMLGIGYLADREKRKRQETERELAKRVILSS